MNLLRKFPYLKKDILWAVGLVIFFLLCGSPTLTLPWVHNIAFIVFVILAWKKKTKFSNELNSLLSVGRVFSLMSIIAVLLSFIILFYSVFQSNNMAYLFTLLFVPIRLFMIFALAVYSVQYYIFSLWITNINFTNQKKIILLELAGMVLLLIIGWSRILLK